MVAGPLPSRGGYAGVFVQVSGQNLITAGIVSRNHFG